MVPYLARASLQKLKIPLLQSKMKVLRYFQQILSLVCLGSALLVSKEQIFVEAATGCSAPNFTPRDAKGPFYLPLPNRTSLLAPPSQLENPEQVFHISGTLYGNDCMPLTNTLVEAWYAGEPDSLGNFYSVAGSDLDYRGAVVSDDCGMYEMTQTFPAVYPARPILHVHFRIATLKEDQELLVTQMYFEDQVPASFVTSRKLQIVNVNQDMSGERSSVFDITVNIPRNLDSGSADFVEKNCTNIVVQGTEAPSMSPSASPSSSPSSLPSLVVLTESPSSPPTSAAPTTFDNDPTTGGDDAADDDGSAAASLYGLPLSAGMILMTFISSL